MKPMAKAGRVGRGVAVLLAQSKLVYNNRHDTEIGGADKLQERFVEGLGLGRGSCRWVK